MAQTKTDRRNKIKRRIRAKISGCSERPRLSVFRSSKQIFVQLVNDSNGTTIAAASSLIKEIAGQSGTKTEKAAMVGKLIAQRAIEKGIEKVVFDRNGYLYHGRVKQLADAAREAGLKF